MNNIAKIKKLSIWIFVIPIVILNLCLFITQNYQIFENTIFAVDQIGMSGFTIPYIDGGVSISRAVRTYPTYLLFKPGMIITAILLIKYWMASNKLIMEINQERKKKEKFLIFGVLSAIFLITHSIFLGVSFENDLYKFFRRFVLLAFIIFELVAQTLLVMKLYSAKEKILEITNKNVLFLKIGLVITLIVVALVSLPFLVSSGYTHFKHALEWNYFVGIVVFYLLTFFFWKK